MLWKITFYGPGGPEGEQVMYLSDVGPIQDVVEQAAEILESGYTISGVVNISIDELKVEIA